MAKPEWGVKRVCQSCAAKFYDLKRSPITCPKCNAPFDPEALLKSRRSRPSPAKAAKPAPAGGAKADSVKAEDAKADGAKADGAKADGAKADDAKADDAKAGGAKAEAGKPPEDDAKPDEDSGETAGQSDDDGDDSSVLQDTSELGEDDAIKVAVPGKDDG